MGYKGRKDAVLMKISLILSYVTKYIVNSLDKLIYMSTILINNQIGAEQQKAEGAMLCRRQQIRSIFITL
jgi:hypothetical protein